jgi:hypothetical protein
MTFYGNKPVEYVQDFITLATFVHTLTNMTAMLWSPNTGGGYPYGYPTSDPSFPKANDADPDNQANFQKMDTNNDNVIDSRDDPYLPYYPGDQYVDWVGLSLYGSQESQGQTVASQSTAISGILSGSGTTAFNNFYDRFSKAKGKPFILSETGTAVQSNINGNTVRTPATPQQELTLKQTWWNNIFSLKTQFPNFRGAVWFEVF